jgi:hypothetical protein
LIGVFDLLTLAVAVVGYALGRSRGFAWQVSGLVTLVGGAICATVLSRPLGPLFGEGILGAFAAWVVIYAVIAICLYVLTLRFKGKLEDMEFDELDRRFGGLLGGFKALAAFGVVTLVAVPLSSGVERSVKGSVAGRALQATVHELRPLLPERIHDAFGPYLDRVEGDSDTEPSATPSPTTSPPAAPPSSPASPAPTRAPAPPVRQPSSAQASPTPRVSPLSPPPASSTPAAASPEVTDPFDPSQDPTDPLAPPR